MTLRPATQRIHESKSQIVHIINVLLTCLGLTAQTPDSLAVAVGDTLQEQRIDSLALHTVDSLRIPQFDAEGKQIPDSLGYIYHLDSLGYIKIDSLGYFMIDSLATFSKKEMKRFAKQKRKAEKALADSIYRSTFHTLETYAVPIL